MVTSQQPVEELVVLATSSPAALGLPEIEAVLGRKAEILDVLGEEANGFPDAFEIARRRLKRMAELEELTTPQLNSMRLNHLARAGWVPFRNRTVPAHEDEAIINAILATRPPEIRDPTAKWQA